MILPFYRLWPSTLSFLVLLLALVVRLVQNKERTFGAIPDCCWCQERLLPSSLQCKLNFIFHDWIRNKCVLFDVCVYWIVLSFHIMILEYYILEQSRKEQFSWNGPSMISGPTPHLEVILKDLSENRLDGGLSNLI